ncbi:cytochrome-c peroxidase [Exilibacterium tricleocarpae]|uniref:Cytochrome-c peroxidase n=1 Tax=Exilibacterium tricleocarpae TaxID=2591008 RepID=A0A545SYV3_9GAMM|nr:parallel beta-helix domain-containing protein [Exilibacterium tricleocarpae]TQV70145.1 cytochrome-c peroxidase [Exilibacterium tricleocarpae]
MKKIILGFGCLLGLLVAVTVPAAEIKVKDGDSIQAAVKKAQPGDTILVYPGTYNESVYIDKDSITVRGVIEEGEWPTLDGEKKLNDAVLYSGNNITIEQLKIIRYKGNAIMGQAGNNYVIRHNWVIDTGVYGIFPQFGENGLIEYNVLSGIEDAAIYVGMCDHVDVRHNEVFNNVAGIEIENTRHAIVENNYVHNNTGGILTFITPGLPIKTTYDVIIRNNFVVNNNTPNFGVEGSLVSKVPAGTGIIVMAGDDVVIEGNIISGNNTAGIVITDLTFVTDIASDPDSEPNPDRIKILRNFMVNNGAEPVAAVRALALTHFTTKGPDVLADGSAKDKARGSCIVDNNSYRTFGLRHWGECDATATTAAIRSHRLDKPVPARKITNDADRVEKLYNGICAGCHAYNVRMVGPPTQVIQAIHRNNPQAIADYIAKPVKKRPDYPEMPPQDHLSAEIRFKVAEHMLKLEK